MATISFMSANYVARQVGYAMTEGWGQGDSATHAAFEPLDTFRERFSTIVSDIRTMGFDAMDLWTAHLNPQWATAEHIAIARSVLAERGVTVVSLAGYFGSTAAEVETTCRLAHALGAPVLGGSTGLLTSDRALLVELLHDYGLRLGIENHAEKTPAELLAKIGDGGRGVIGAAVDTGWWATQGYDAAEAIAQLEGHLVHVHLKDVLAADPGAVPGKTMKSIGHETCAFGQGIVPLQRCVRELKRQGYPDALSIEHEPEDADPTPAVVASLALLRTWLADAQ